MTSSPLIDGLEFGSCICEVAGLCVRGAKSAQQVELLTVTIPDEPSSTARVAFDRIVRFGAFGGLEVERADRFAILASPWASGTMAHLPSLGWRLHDRLSVFEEVAHLVLNFHEEGCAAGPFDPNFIMLDEDFRPFLMGPSIAPTDTPYTARETVQSARADLSSDIYSLGRLLHFVLTQEAPAVSTEDPSLLKELVTYPAGLSRIIRKATRRYARDRYPNVQAFLEDLSRFGRYDEVGLAHPDVEEQNLGGTSYRPQVQRATQTPPSGQSRLPAARSNVPEFKKINPFVLQSGPRAWLLAAGLIGVCAILVGSYVAGQLSWLRAGFAAAAGLVGFSMFGPGADKEASLRLAFGTFFAAAMFLWNPTALVHELAQETGLGSSDVAKRTDAFRAMLDKGHATYSGVDLSGADLSEMSFLLIDLDGAKLASADLKSSRFFRANVSATDFRNADLRGAIFEATPVDKAMYFDRAICDDTTKLPHDWTCADGHPLREPQVMAERDTTNNDAK